MKKGKSKTKEIPRVTLKRTKDSAINNSVEEEQEKRYQMKSQV